MPSLPSYLLENMVLNYFETGSHIQYVDFEVRDFLKYISLNIYGPLYDPKNIQGDLNLMSLSLDEKNKISQRAILDNSKAIEATELEQQGKMSDSISKWKEIFGDQFNK